MTEFPAIEQKLRALMSTLAGDLSADDMRWAEFFIEHNEKGLALLGLAESLMSRGKPQSSEVIGAIEELADRMRVRDELPNLAAITER